MLPLESSVTSFGELNCAAAGAPPSADKPALPLPVNVWMVYCWPWAAERHSSPRHTANERPRIFIIDIYSVNARAPAAVTGNGRLGLHHPGKSVTPPPNTAYLQCMVAAIIQEIPSATAPATMAAAILRSSPIGFHSATRATWTTSP